MKLWHLGSITLRHPYYANKSTFIEVILRIRTCFCTIFRGDTPQHDRGGEILGALFSFKLWYTSTFASHKERYMYVWFSIIYQHLDDTDNWNSSSWRKRTSSCYTVNTIIADDLATPGARASSVMVLILFNQNILLSAPEALMVILCLLHINRGWRSDRL